MSDSPHAFPPRVLYCRCAYAQVVPREVKDGVLRHLCASGAAFESVADLCEMSARRDLRLAEIASEAGGQLKIAACHPRAVRWLFHAAGAPLPADGAAVSVVNMRALSVDEACAELDAAVTDDGGGVDNDGAGTGARASAVEAAPAAAAEVKEAAA